MATITLSNGLPCVVDDDDYAHLSQWKWKFHKASGCQGGYAARTGWDRNARRFTIILMHRVINGTPPGSATDHINGDKLDNRRSNLRTANNVQNMQNRGAQCNSATGIRGVCFDKSRRKWIASFDLNKKTVFRKRFSKKCDAILAVKQVRASALATPAF